MQNLPDGWTVPDLQRFNAVQDVVAAYQAFDYARKVVAPNDAFLKARQDDIGALALALGQQFKQQFGQP